MFFGVEEMVGDQKFFFYPTVIAPSIVEWIQVCSVMMILAHFLLLLSLVCFVVVCRDMAWIMCGASSAEAGDTL